MVRRFSFLLGPRCANFPRTCSATVGERGSDDGRSCWVAQLRRYSPCLSSTLHLMAPMARSLQVHCEARAFLSALDGHSIST